MAAMGVEGLAGLGFGGGSIIGQQADDEARRQVLERQKLQTEIEGHADLRSMQAAHGRLYNQQAIDLQLKRDRETEIARLMRARFPESTVQAAGAGEGKIDPLTPLMVMADTMVAAGDIPGAAAAYSKAGTVLNQMSSAANAQSNAELHQIQQRQRKLDEKGQILNGVNSPEQAVRAAIAYKKATGEDLFPPGVPWTPALNESVRAQGMTANQRDIRDHEIAREQRQAKMDALKQRVDTARLGLIEQQTQTEAVRRERLGKGGRNAVGVPTAREEAAARSAVLAAFPGMTLPVGPLVNDIAVQAKVRMKDPTYGVDSFDEAVEQIIAENVASGAIEEVTSQREIPLIGEYLPGKKELRYATGRTPATARPAVPGQVEYNPNIFYKWPGTGKIVKWAPDYINGQSKEPGRFYEVDIPGQRPEAVPSGAGKKRNASLKEQLEAVKAQ